MEGKQRTERALELLELKSGLVVSGRAGSLDAGTGCSLEGAAAADTGEVGAAGSGEECVSISMAQQIMRKVLTRKSNQQLKQRQPSS